MCLAVLKLKEMRVPEEGHCREDSRTQRLGTRKSREALALDISGVVGGSPVNLAKASGCRDPRSGPGFSALSSRLWEFLGYLKARTERQRKEQCDGWERTSQPPSGVAVHA